MSTQRRVSSWLNGRPPAFCNTHIVAPVEATDDVGTERARLKYDGWRDASNKDGSNSGRVLQIGPVNRVKTESKETDKPVVKEYERNADRCVVH